ncbi:hypothetical protein [Fibrella aquatilis]|uniref:Transglycosylase SLT domain-containing protein n=1 Tax=Fibrella aquatilis TaxID=2817059 RepID=A0A939GB73_9BACT|nr:hypothetical protein [Fibrella aquatilis]MBO0934603.1 hypothetical protein [Fibrella aquatilis]
MALAYLERVPTDRDAFGRKVIAIAGRLGVQPDWLMIVMNFETAGLFKPGYYASSGAVGLIQFTSAGASQVGSTKDALSKLTAIQQLDYVEKYFVSWKAVGKMHSLEDVYTIVFAPAYLGRDPASVIHRKGTAAYAANAPLDRGKKGYITLADIQATIRKYVPSGYVEPTTSVGIGAVALLAGGYWLYQRSKRSTDE